MNINILFKNKVILYIVSRYAVYGLQFIIGLIIAGKLGPYYLGVYGFIQLILLYFENINFGIPHSLNVYLIHNKNNKYRSDNYVANSILLILYMAIIIVIVYIYVQIFGIKSFERYHVNKYFIIVCIIALLQNFNAVIATIVRIKNKLNLLNFMQSFTIILNLIGILIFSKESLIICLVMNLLVSDIIYVALAFKNNLIPNFRDASISLSYQGDLIKKGFFLFLYNSCFYFIIISIRTLISKYYTIEEFGMFTFSYSLGSALLLLTNSMSTIIFPKVIDKLSSNNIDEVNNTLKTVRIVFISTSHFLVYFALPFFPLLICVLPKYANALTAMNLIALSILISTNSFGYTTILIARNKERTSARISIVSLVLNIIISIILVLIFKVEFSYVIIATLITYLFFSFAAMVYGSKSIKQYSLKAVLKGFFPIRLFIPYSVALIISMLRIEYLMFLPILLYIIFNINDLKEIFNKYLKRMINHPDIADLK